MPFVVREAGPDDARALAQLHVAAWHAAAHGVKGLESMAAVTVDERQERWERFFAEGHGAQHSITGDEAVVLLAILDDEPVATIAYGDARDQGDDFPSGELWSLTAHPTVFGTGAATRLHARAIEGLGELGHDAAYLWVPSKSVRARGFYSREGWEVTRVTRTLEFLGSTIHEVRYTRAL